MALTEKQIEDLIYISPWIIDERFIIPEIKGENGVHGRQINLGRTSNRFVDLLLKDTRDNRPVIVELKKGDLKRSDIGQILEYRSLLVSLEEIERKEWTDEFGYNYYCPKMILIGSDASENIVLAANLAGIEIRTFKSEHVKDFGFATFKELKSKAKEWDDFRKKGHRTLAERNEWLIDILNRTKRIVSSKEEVTTLTRLPELSSIRDFYANNRSPFIDIPIFYKGQFLCGFYEYFDTELIFNDQHIYFDYSFIIDGDLDEQGLEKCISELENFLSVYNIGFVYYGEKNVPVIKIPRLILNSENAFSDFLKRLIDFGIKMFNKYQIPDANK